MAGNTKTSRAQSRFSVGTVLRPHGLAGEVKIHLNLSDITMLNGLQTLTADFPDGRVEELALERVSVGGRNVLMAFKGVTSRAAADGLRGVALSVARKDLPPLGIGEYYLGDLVGYDVVSDKGRVIGQVRETWDLPANDVLQVMDGERELLIPLIDDVVREIDHPGRRVVIAVMEGLLE